MKGKFIFQMLSLCILLFSCSTNFSTSEKIKVVEGQSESLLWSTYSGETPKVEITFFEDKDFFAKINSISISYDNYKILVDDKVLKQNENQLIFIDFDVSPVVWKEKGSARVLEFHGGDGGETFVIELVIEEGRLLSYEIRR